MGDEAHGTSESSGRLQRGLNVAEQAAKIVSLVAIPVVLGVVGWVVQKRIQDQAVSRDYVQLAVSLLRDRDTVAVGRELRAWAVELLDESAPVQMGKTARDSLARGNAVLPAVQEATATPEQLELVRQLNAPERALREQAFTALDTTLDSPAMVVALLNRLAGAPLDSLSGNGLYNTLKKLTQMLPTAWSPSQLTRADSIIATLRVLARDDPNRVGRRNLERVDSLQQYLARVRARNR